MQAIGVERAHISGLSLGAATGLWLAAKYPQRVKSLSLHSGWTKSDPFLKAVAEGWQTIAKGLGNVTERSSRASFLGALRPSYTPPNRNTLTSLQHSCAVGQSSRLMLSSANLTR
jgi:3-oxoadipate enol-lactonase